MPSCPKLDLLWYFCALTQIRADPFIQTFLPDDPDAFTGRTKRARKKDFGQGRVPKPPHPY